MRTAGRKRKEATRKWIGFGVVVGRVSVVLYNDHVEALPLVVICAKIEPLGEASSFLAPLPAIILYNAITVKPTIASSPFFTTSSPSNHCDRYWVCSALLPSNLAEISLVLTKKCGR